MVAPTIQEILEKSKQKAPVPPISTLAIPAQPIAAVATPSLSPARESRKEKAKEKRKEKRRSDKRGWSSVTSEQTGSRKRPLTPRTDVMVVDDPGNGTGSLATSEPPPTEGALGAAPDPPCPDSVLLSYGMRLPQLIRNALTKADWDAFSTRPVSENITVALSANAKALDFLRIADRHAKAQLDRTQHEGCKAQKILKVAKDRAAEE